MYYDSIKNEHGLKHDPFKALVAPRPIGWVSTVDKNGVLNLAPYSFFNAVSERPHYVMFVSANRKDSLRNIEDNGEFTCSISTMDTRDGMNISSASVDSLSDEFALSNLETAQSFFVTPPRVARSPASLECKHWKTVELPDVSGDRGHFIVIGQVVGIFIDDNVIKDGIVDTASMRPLARMGYMDYAVVTRETTFTLQRPQVEDDGTVTIPEGDWDGIYR
jgi:flavin reductase (DIM6/NTAB) family NADH-FMN oxidoreductase RutF